MREAAKVGQEVMYQERGMFVVSHVKEVILTDRRPIYVLESGVTLPSYLVSIVKGRVTDADAA